MQGEFPDDDYAWAPLSIACAYGYLRTVEALLAGDADPNAVCYHKSDTILWYPTVYSPNVECVRAMLRYGADPNQSQLDPPLLVDMMIFNRNDSAPLIPICDSLLHGTCPINLNATNNDGQTALMVASGFNNIDMVNWLLKYGADTDVLDRFNNSALWYASYKGNVGIATSLLNKRAKIDVAHAAGRDPLLFGADFALYNSSGDAFMMEVSKSRQIEVTKMLIEKGADINRKGTNGETPIFLAIGHHHNNALTRLLAENGAKMDGMVRNTSTPSTWFGH
ncbi:ankyrin repeat-containing domain protein [Camillea tinctor]|nr:ankyrin repeat-containing domain protein [Camillea tinctor]